MLTFIKINALLVLSGLIISSTEGMPLMDTTTMEKQTLVARTLPKKSKCPAYTLTASKKQSNLNSKSSLKTRDGDELVRRALHPSPGERITLAHGTTQDFAFDHSKTSKSGDFHAGRPGFYLTDDAEHAAMWACQTHCLKPEDEAVVQAYIWAGTTPDKYHVFPSKDDPTWQKYRAWIIALDAWIFRDTSGAGAAVPEPTAEPHIKALHDMEMLAGPMGPPTDDAEDLGNIMWQYVLINPSAASKLTKAGVQRVPCKNFLRAVPKQ